MKFTKNTIAKLVKCLENNSGFTAYDVRIENSDEPIIRYEDGNNVTHSIYFTDDECITGYLIDGAYKWHSTRKLSAYDDTSMFLFDIGITLKDQYRYVEKYVLV
jgi:hypothetical protein